MAETPVAEEAAALSGGEAYVATSDGWSLTAHTPILVDKGIIQGSATFARTSGALTRGGGVCLIADLNDNFPCESDADCEGLHVPPGGYLYCAGINGFENKRCWTRPSNNCTRSQAREPGTYTSLAVPARVNGKMVKWVTIACMGVESNPAGCGSLDPTQSVKATSHLFGDEQ